MNKIRILLLVATLVLGLSGVTKAAVLDFEGVTSDSAAIIPSGYGGFNWDSAWYLYNDTVYSVPAHSGHYAIVNNFGDDPAGLSSSSPFDFNGVWVSGWNYNAPGQIQVRGFDASWNLIGETNWFTVTGNSQYLSANLYGVSKLEFLGGHFFTLDDFTYNAIDNKEAVPEPATMSLLGFGLVGLAGLKRRREVKQ